MPERGSHIHHTHTLQCDHIVTCGCGHKPGDMVWCMVCQDYKMVKSIMIWQESGKPGELVTE